MGLSLYLRQGGFGFRLRHRSWFSESLFPCYKMGCPPYRAVSEDSVRQYVE